MDMACGDHKIYAVSDGKVKYTGYSRGGYGNYIVIHHNIMVENIHHYMDI